MTWPVRKAEHNAGSDAPIPQSAVAGDALAGAHHAAKAPASYFSRTLAVLHHRAYFWLWLAISGYAVSESVEFVGRNWLLWQMTHSPLLLGLMNLARSVPRLIFGLAGGVMADRVDKRRLLIFSQVTLVALNAVMALLVWTHWIQVWHVFALALLAGVNMAVLAPTRESLTPALVPHDQLVSAVSLNRIAQFVLFLLTPAVAGPASIVIGLGGLFLIAAAVNGIVVVLSCQLPPVAPASRRVSWWGDMAGGLHYVTSHSIMLRLMVLSLVPMVFAMPYQTLLPVFADRVLGMGVSGYGMLLGAVGVGAIVGMVILALSSGARHQGKVVLLSIAILGVVLVAFSLSRWLPTSLLFMVGVGAASFVYRTLTVTLMYGLTPPDMYGRVMSMLLLDFALMSFGSMLAGALASSYGAPTALAVMGSVVVLLALGMGLTSRELRQLRLEAREKPAAE